MNVFYNNRIPFGFYFRTFELGKLYITHMGKIVKFIKVTKKGYNLLDINTNKCILKHHLYSKNYSNKDIPEDDKIIKNIRMNEWLTLYDYKLPVKENL